MSEDIGRRESDVTGKSKIATSLGYVDRFLRGIKAYLALKLL